MTRKFNANLLEIANMLSDGQHHAGDVMGSELGVTRAAIWKGVKKLQEYGIKINSVKGKGYALLEPLILLDVSKIRLLLNNKKLTMSLFESIPSTNDCLKALKDKKQIHFCLAEQQTHGKGRLGREWHSPFGQNIYLSCLYPFQKDISELAGLSLAVTLATVKALKRSGMGKDLCAKWPNDITCQGKKISGSLIEVQAESHGSCQVIIGIGINVNMLHAGKQVSQPWTSMQMVLGTYQDRNKICADLINELMHCLQQFDESGFSSFAKEWMNLDGLMNQSITLKNVNEKIMGKAVGINDQGHLMLQMQDGTVRVFSSGDTTIIKQ